MNPTAAIAGGFHVLFERESTDQRHVTHTDRRRAADIPGASEPSGLGGRCGTAGTETGFRASVSDCVFAETSVEYFRGWSGL
jgi:hypothetical protein